MHLVYCKLYASFLSGNCRHLNAGTLHCSSYPLPSVRRQCTRISGVLFLCAYRTYKTCLHDATCQSTQTLYSSVLAENNRHFEISKWCIDEVMLPYVHRRSYAVLRASTMYLYLYMSYFPVCFPHFFTCLHYASLSIANAMPLFWLGIVAI